MATTLSSRILADLHTLAHPGKAADLARFFKTGKGQYGEGDLFLGITVPEQRALAKRYAATDLPTSELLPTLDTLLASPYHEARLTALLILLERATRARYDTATRQACVDFYLAHTHRINNWDLVDLSCYKLLGPWLQDKDRSLLHRLALSTDLWEQRIAIVTTMHFVRQDDFHDCLAIADTLLHHPHHLIHKAVGWLLREVGKKDRPTLLAFLDTRHTHMPRTMLRYAIERLSPAQRRHYLQR